MRASFPFRPPPPLLIHPCQAGAERRVPGLCLGRGWAHRHTVQLVGGGHGLHGARRCGREARCKWGVYGECTGRLGPNGTALLPRRPDAVGSHGMAQHQGLRRHGIVCGTPPPPPPVEAPASRSWNLTDGCPEPDSPSPSTSSMSSGLSTDVSNTRRVKYMRIREGRGNQESFHRA